VTQTLAIFKDAYRELNHKKLFWVVLGLSLAVVTSFALLGNNEKGMTVLGYTLEIPFLSTRAVSSAGFYKFIFNSVGVKFWLTWGATILALISTAGMIPDFVASGAIDMTLSKPIGRLRLFLTKYAAGLLFVALQVVVFSLGAFIVIGVRGKAWEPSLFLAVPIVVLFYSYLFCVCALVGMVTRSGITALLLTMLFWLGLWAISTAETQLLTFKLQSQSNVARDQGSVKRISETLEWNRKQLAALETAPAGRSAPAALNSASPESATPSSDKAANGRNTKPVDASSTSEGNQQAAASADTDGPSGPPRGRARRDRERREALLQRVLKATAPTNDPVEVRRRIEEWESELATAQRSLEESEASAKSLARWQGLFYATKTVLPKTGETTDLLGRYVIDKEDRDGLLRMIEEQSGETTATDVQNTLTARSIGWIVGTSLAFQGVVLGIACWIFCRRDF
jgi:ABC-type transport system involved in multi-copper enzyme maturation permease subunit